MKVKKERERNLKQPPISERLKTVVRRLPPNLPEDVFWGSVGTWVTEDTVTWKSYYLGKLRKRLNKESIPSRAYIAFKDEEQLALFSREYDGHLFRDKTGSEYQAVVEFAPYQKVPSDKKKVDARNATIEKDEDYISFIESLKSTTNAEPISIETLVNHHTVAASQPAPPPKTTPLLEALKAEKSAHKDKEAILRNHAHYKDATILASPRKEEPKKKGALPQKPAEPTPSSSKKGLKKQAPLSVPPSAQKPPPAIANAVKIPAAAPGPSHAGPKSPKPPRAKPTAHAKPPQGGPKPPPAPIATTPAAPPVIAQAPGPVPPVPGGAAPAVPPRRARPVIGLASRQFEAALSGAGVGAGGDRKSRREREREKEAQGGAVPAGPPPAAPAKPAPPSPRRARNPKEAGGGAAPAGSNAPPPKVPVILQPPSTAAAAATPLNGASHQEGVPSNRGAGGGGGARGGRRGRGRGRGGGNQDAPVRGG
ncbi:Smg-4/UPF3 family-domain-containing protein [Lyophyllum atratum]|nr:Smg-4/UPF3 family-domain-containing protein [Lyophyllum atratum]